MERKRLVFIKWFYPILFVFYISGITLFTHSHIVNNTKVVHSHPFKAKDHATHEHTEKEIQLLDQLYNTSITNDIIPAIDCNGVFIVNTIHFADIYLQEHIIRTDAPLQLRAPPKSI